MINGFYLSETQHNKTWFLSLLWNIFTHIRCRTLSRVFIVVENYRELSVVIENYRPFYHYGNHRKVCYSSPQYSSLQFLSAREKKAIVEGFCPWHARIFCPKHSLKKTTRALANREFLRERPLRQWYPACRAFLASGSLRAGRTKPLTAFVAVRSFCIGLLVHLIWQIWWKKMLK